MTRSLRGPITMAFPKMCPWRRPHSPQLPCPALIKLCDVRLSWVSSAQKASVLDIFILVLIKKQGFNWARRNLI